MAFSLDAARAAEKNLYYLYGFTSTAQASGPDSSWAYGYLERFNTALNDDLNTPEALAVVLEMVSKAYRDSDHRIWNTLKKFDSVLGLRLEDQFTFLRKAVAPPDIQALIDERAEARREKNFKRSDELRQQIIANGWSVTDNRDGTSDYMPSWN
jgi:cysteinyl-tRNA synthetase